MSLRALEAIHESDFMFKRWLRGHGFASSSSSSGGLTAADLTAFTGSTNLVTFGAVPSIGIGIAAPPIAGGSPRLDIKGTDANSPLARFQTLTNTPRVEIYSQSGLAWIGASSAGSQSFYLSAGGVVGLAGSTINIGSSLETADYAYFDTSGTHLAVLSAEATDVDTFLVANSGLIKSRTGVQVLSDIGGISGSSPSITTPDIITGFKIAGAAATGVFPRGNATNFVASTLTLPNAGTTGDVFVATGTNAMGVVAAQATANKILMSGASAVPTWSIPTYPNASSPTALKLIRSDGTNWIASTATFSDSPSTAGKVLISDGTNWITSTPTYPNSAGTVGNYIQSDGTNVVSGSGAGQASIVAASAGINTTETLIVKTVALAANRLQAGTVIRVTLIGSCTTTAANTSTFNIRIGTAGTTSDGLMQQAVTPVAGTTGTAIPFKVVYECIVRTTGASATSHGYATLETTGVTGISATQSPNVILPSFTNFNTTTANMIISACYVSAATTTTSTFQDAFIEIIYK